MLHYSIFNKIFKARVPGLFHRTTKVYKLRLCELCCNVSHCLSCPVYPPGTGLKGLSCS